MAYFSDRILFYARNFSKYKWEKKGFNPSFFQKLTSGYFVNFGINTIIDIGANEGQSTITFRLAFPKATIHAFEPLPDCFKKLEVNMANLSDIVLYNLAIGDEIGQLTFEQNEYSASSSALSMSKVHVDNFPFTRNSKKVEVDVQKLDDLFGNRTDLGNLLIKIDVQGYEKHVLLGGTKTFDKAKLIILETSFETLYEGQPLFDDIYKTVCAMGFTYAGAFDQLISPIDGKILQQDAIFVKAH